MAPVRGACCGLLLLIGLAGCGSGGDTATSSSSVPAESTPSVAKPEKLVVVHESEYKLAPAHANGGDFGIVKIKVVNDGKIPHSLAVDGPNGRIDLDGSVEPGSSG